MLTDCQFQGNIQATKVACSILDFSDTVSFINSLYSITGSFRDWFVTEVEGTLVEYKSEDKTASIISISDRFICCKFYKMLPELLGIQIITPYKCKAITGGIVIEK